MRRLPIDTPPTLALKQGNSFPMVSGRDLLTLRLGLVMVCALLGGVLLTATPALADLKVCNQTANPISVALGYRADNGWQSEGWWVAPPTLCATIYQGALNSRFFYVFAADDIGGGAWDGSVFMCTRDQSFTIFGVEDCLARGYERTGFFEIDTQNRSDWMLQLTNNDAAGSTNGGGAPDQVVPLAGEDGAPLDEVHPLDGPGDSIPLDGPDAVPGGQQESVDTQ
jgi:uncharacterized membrane protein